MKATIVRRISDNGKVFAYIKCLSCKHRKGQLIRLMRSAKEFQRHDMIHANPITTFRTTLEEPLVLNHPNIAPSAYAMYMRTLKEEQAREVDRRKKAVAKG